MLLWLPDLSTWWTNSSSAPPPTATTLHFSSSILLIDGVIRNPFSFFGCRLCLVYHHRCVCQPTTMNKMLIVVVIQNVSVKWQKFDSCDIAFELQYNPLSYDYVLVAKTREHLDRECIKKQNEFIEELKKKNFKVTVSGELNRPVFSCTVKRLRQRVPLGWHFSSLPLNRKL